MRRFRLLVEEHFGKPITEVKQVSGNAFHIVGNGFNIKLDICYSTPEPLNPWWIPYSDPVAPQHKMYKSLPVHMKALELGLYVPNILKIVEEENKIYKFTQWLDGDPIGIIKEQKPHMIPKVFQNFGSYIATLIEYQITPCDPHFANFIWSKAGCVIIDMKKFLYTTEDVHLNQMAKICLKSCRSCRDTAIQVLKGYSLKNSPIKIIKHLDSISWTMGKNIIDRISLEEIYEQPTIT